MQLQKLSLTNFRAFKQAEFEFKPGINLIVGINGVGKSSVLDAIRIMFSRGLPQISHLYKRVLSFTNDDISVGDDALSVSLGFVFAEIPVQGLAHFQREKYISTDVEGDVRNQAYAVDDRYQFSPDLKKINIKISDGFGHPLVVYFSTNRSVIVNAKRQGRPITDPLESRELRLKEFAEWWLVQQALMRETKSPVFGKKMNVLSDTVSGFLDSVENLRGIENPKTSLVVDKKGKLIDIRQLSDGERGLLALVFDLARWLVQANPKLKNPLQDGEAIVLIDELDLHLHPRWQRDVVQKLTTTFPKCQFIATTHSPQVVGEVSPENIIMLDEGKPPYRPDQSLGMDTNWILRHLMGTDELPAQTKKEYGRIAKLIEKEEYDKAEALINKARKKYGETPDLVQLQSRIDSIRILGE